MEKFSASNMGHLVKDPVFVIFMLFDDEAILRGVEAVVE